MKNRQIIEETRNEMVKFQEKENEIFEDLLTNKLGLDLNSADDSILEEYLFDYIYNGGSGHSIKMISEYLDKLGKE